MDKRLSINMKYSSITIGTETLHALGDPESILILVNPEESTLAVTPNQNQDPRGHKVKTDRKGMMRLYSKHLCGAIAPYVPGLAEQSGAVTLVGTSQEDAVLFRLASGTPSCVSGRIPT